MNNRGPGLRYVAAAMVTLLIIGGLAWLILPGGENGRRQSPGIRLFCGAALRPAMDEIAAAFERRTGIRVESTYGASNLLLGQLKLSPQHADLYLPGDAFYVDQAAGEGLVSESTSFAWFVPAILVRAGNPHGIGNLSDLSRPGLRLAVADGRSAAIGRLTPMLLERSGLSEDHIRPNIVYTSVTANELGTAVSLGNVDAAIVWESVARLQQGCETISIPPAQNYLAPLSIGLVSESQRQPAARQFVEFLGSEVAREMLQRHHYSLTPPDSTESAASSETPGDNM